MNCDDENIWRESKITFVQGKTKLKEACLLKCTLHIMETMEPLLEMQVLLESDRQRHRKDLGNHDDASRGDSD